MICPEFCSNCNWYLETFSVFRILLVSGNKFCSQNCVQLISGNIFCLHSTGIWKQILLPDSVQNSTGIWKQILQPDSVQNSLVSGNKFCSQILETFSVSRVPNLAPLPPPANAGFRVCTRHQLLSEQRAGFGLTKFWLQNLFPDMVGPDSCSGLKDGKNMVTG